MALSSTLDELGSSMRSSLNPRQSLNNNEIYDPHQKPANLEMARLHGNAKKLYKYGTEKKNSKKCLCCGLPLEGGAQFELCSDPKEYYHLGSGYSLYFFFYKDVVYLTFFIFLISGVYSLWTNYHGDGCDDVVTSTSYCLRDFIGIFSISNKRNNKRELEIQAILDMAAIGFIILYMHYIRYRVRKITVEADHRTITPSDYTVQLDGLPTSRKNPMSKDEEIIKWVEGHSTPALPIKVASFTRAFKIQGYIRLVKERDSLLERINECKQEKRAELMKAKRRIDDKMKIMRAKGLPLTGTAFISLEKAEQAYYLREKYKRSRLYHHCNKLRWNKGYEMTRAPEPTDINWENLGQHFIVKALRRTFTFFIIVLMVLLVFFIITILTSYQFTLEGDDHWILIINIAISLAIVILDPVICFIIAQLVKAERHTSKTNFINSAAVAMTISKFINNAFTIILARPVLSWYYRNDLKTPSKWKLTGITSVRDFLALADMYGHAGVNPNMFVNILANTYTNVLTVFFDPEWLLKRLQRWWVSRKGDKNNLTQAEANELFEGADYEIEERYGYLVSTFVLQCMYAGALPMTTPIVIIGMIINYWADKQFFLRRVALPHSLGNTVQKEMTEYLEWGPLFYAIGNAMYYYSIQDSTNAYVFDATSSTMLLIYLFAAISILNMWLPMESINRCLFPIREAPIETLTYEQARGLFISDYEIENPLTRKRAFMKLMQNAVLRKTLFRNPRFSITNPKNFTAKHRTLLIQAKNSARNSRENSVVTDKNQPTPTVSQISSMILDGRASIQNPVDEESHVNVSAINHESHETSEEMVPVDQGDFDTIEEYGANMLEDPKKALQQLSNIDRLTRIDRENTGKWDSMILGEISEDETEDNGSRPVSKTIENSENKEHEVSIELQDRSMVASSIENSFVKDLPSTERDLKENES